MSEKNLQIAQTVISSICETEIEDVETAQTVTSLFNQLIAEVRRLNERLNQITQNYNKRIEKYHYLEKELEQHKLQEAYLLARLKKVEVKHAQ